MMSKCSALIIWHRLHRRQTREKGHTALADSTTHTSPAPENEEYRAHSNKRAQTERYRAVCRAYASGTGEHAPSITMELSTPTVWNEVASIVISMRILNGLQN
jgi:hypothetical protein